MAFRVMVLIVVATLALPLHAADPIVIKFSHVVADDTPKGKGALKFKELAEARTNGAVKVEVYPNSTLYKDKEELEALQLGAVHMLAPSLAKFAPLGVKEFQVFDLPYLFDTYADLDKVTSGPVGRTLLKRLEDKGILGLAYWHNGFKVMSAKRRVRKPDDLKGMHVRIQSSKVLDAQMRALGAIPHAMAFSDVYQALRTGIVDGTENPPSNLYTQRMHEVQKHVALTNHGYLGYAVIVNKRYWERLPTSIRRTLEMALADATAYANDIAKQENDNALEAVRKSRKSTIYTPTAEEKRAWKRALIRVHREQEERIGKEIIHAIYRATGFDPDKL